MSTEKKKRFETINLSPIRKEHTSYVRFNMEEEVVVLSPAVVEVVALADNLPCNQEKQRSQSFAEEGTAYRESGDVVGIVDPGNQWKKISLANRLFRWSFVHLWMKIRNVIKNVLNQNSLEYAIVQLVYTIGFWCRGFRS